MKVGPQTFKVLNKCEVTEVRNFGMTEGHGKSNIAPLFQMHIQSIILTQKPTFNLALSDCSRAN